MKFSLVPADSQDKQTKEAFHIQRGYFLCIVLLLLICLGSQSFLSRQTYPHHRDQVPERTNWTKQNNVKNIIPLDGCCFLTVSPNFLLHPIGSASLYFSIYSVFGKQFFKGLMFLTQVYCLFTQFPSHASPYMFSMLGILFSHESRRFF